MKIIETDMDLLHGQPRPVVDFHRARNAVVECCRNFGSVGAMGTCPIHGDEPDEDKWQVETQDPEFFVTDDFLHPCQRYVRVDVRMNLLSLAVLESLSKVAEVTGWAVWIRLADEKENVNEEVVVLENGLMVGGDLLDHCVDVCDVVLACHGKGRTTA